MQYINIVSLFQQSFVLLITLCSNVFSNAFSLQLYFTISDYVPVSARPAVPVLLPDSPQSW